MHIQKDPGAKVSIPLDASLHFVEKFFVIGALLRLEPSPVHDITHSIKPPLLHLPLSLFLREVLGVPVTFGGAVDVESVQDDGSALIVSKVAGVSRLEGIPCPKSLEDSGDLWKNTVIIGADEPFVAESLHSADAFVTSASPTTPAASDGLAGECAIGAVAHKRRCHQHGDNEQSHYPRRAGCIVLQSRLLCTQLLNHKWFWRSNGGRGGSLSDSPGHAHSPHEEPLEWNKETRLYKCRKIQTM